MFLPSFSPQHPARIRATTSEQAEISLVTSFHQQPLENDSYNFHETKKRPGLTMNFFTLDGDNPQV